MFSFRGYVHKGDKLFSTIKNDELDKVVRKASKQVKLPRMRSVRLSSSASASARNGVPEAGEGRNVAAAAAAEV